MGNRLPCVSGDVPMGTHGRESTGVSPERGKSTVLVAHSKNLASCDVIRGREPFDHVREQHIPGGNLPIGLWLVCLIVIPFLGLSIHEGTYNSYKVEVPLSGAAVMVKVVVDSFILSLVHDI